MASTRLVSSGGDGRIRFSGATPDRMAALTIGAWFQSPTVPGSAFATILAPFGAGSDQTDLLYITDNYSGNPPTFFVYCAPSFGGADSGVAAGTAWFHWSVAYSASGATCRVIRDVSGTLTVVASWTIPRESWACAGVDFFNGIYNEPARTDTQIAYARVYAATLDATALLAEAASTTPTVSVWADWPLQDADLADASGNGRNLATSGTITLGAGTSSPPTAAPSTSAAGSSSLTFAAAATAAVAAAVSGSSSLTFAASGVVEAGATSGSAAVTFTASATAARVVAASGSASVAFSAAGGVAGGPSAVAVYRIDEAGSGSGVSTLVDASGSGLDLAVSYVEGDPVFVTGTHGRGFDFNRTSPFGAPGAGAHRLLTSTDAAYTSFNGSRYYVIEAVAEIPNLGAGDEFGPACLAGIFREDGENDPIGLWWWNRKMIVDVTGQAGFEGGGYTGLTFDYVNAAYSAGTLTPGIHVFHAVFDSTEVNSADRLRLYVDGVRQTSSGNTGEGPGDHVVDLNEQIMIPLTGSGLPRAGDHYLCVGGFKNYGFGLHGGWEGAIYWVRLDDSAPSDASITERAGLLSTSWDLVESYSLIADRFGSAAMAFAASATAALMTAAVGASSLTFAASAASAAALTVSGSAVATFDGVGAAALTAATDGSASVALGASAGVAATIEAQGTSSLTFAASAPAAVVVSADGSTVLSFSGEGFGEGLTPGSASGAVALLFSAAAVAGAIVEASGSASLVFAVAGVGSGGATSLPSPSPRFFFRLDHRPKDIIMGIDSRESRLLGTRTKVASERYSLTVAVDVPAGDSVSSITSVVATGSGGVTIGTGEYAPSRSGNRVTVWVEGGTPSSSAALATSTVRITVGTAAGRALVGDVAIRVLA